MAKYKYTKKKTKSDSEEKSSSTKKTTTVKMRYIGMAKKAVRLGEKTGERYVFEKEDGIPQPTEVNKEDANFLMVETGRGCYRRAPSLLFILDEEFDEAYCA